MINRFCLQKTASYDIVSADNGDLDDDDDDDDAGDGQL